MHSSVRVMCQYRGWACRLVDSETCCSVTPGARVSCWCLLTQESVSQTNCTLAVLVYIYEHIPNQKPQMYATWTRGVAVVSIPHFCFNCIVIAPPPPPGMFSILFQCFDYPVQLFPAGGSTVSVRINSRKLDNEVKLF